MKTLAAIALTMVAVTVVAEPLQPDIALPSPSTSGGKPLRDALNARQSTRAYNPDPLPPQVLSDLLTIKDTFEVRARHVDQGARDRVLAVLTGSGAEVVEAGSAHASLEDLFRQVVRGEPAGAAEKVDSE